MKVHHIGYLVKNIAKSLNGFYALGYNLDSEIVYDESRESDICFIRNGDYVVELIAPKKGSPLYETFKRYPHMPYHMCYECMDVAKEEYDLAQAGFSKILDWEIAPAIGNEAKVCFMIHPLSGMVELVRHY